MNIYFKAKDEAPLYDFGVKMGRKLTFFVKRDKPTLDQARRVVDLKETTKARNDNADYAEDFSAYSLGTLGGLPDMVESDPYSNQTAG